MIKVLGDEVKEALEYFWTFREAPEKGSTYEMVTTKDLDQLIEKANRVDELTTANHKLKLNECYLEKENEQLKQDALLGKAVEKGYEVD